MCVRHGHHYTHHSCETKRLTVIGSSTQLVSLYVCVQIQYASMWIFVSVHGICICMPLSMCTVYEMFGCTCVEASEECGVVTRGLVKMGLFRQAVALGCLALCPFQYSCQWEGRTRLYQFTSRDSGTDHRNE